MKNTKRLLSLLLAIVMIAGMFTFITVGTSAAAWDGTTKTAPEGDGTEANPYKIATAENLAWLSAQVNAGTDYEGKFFVQTADIDLGNKAFTPIGSYMKLADIPPAKAGGTPSPADYTIGDLQVGEGSLVFKGTYNGGGFKISNATIASAQKDPMLMNDQVDAKETIANAMYPAALFGAVANAKIMNVNVCNIKAGTLKDIATPANVTAAEGENIKYEDVFDTYFAAALVGMCLSSEIDACSTDANCAAVGVVAGGMIAVVSSRTKVTRCVNNGSSTAEWCAGGVIGGGGPELVELCINNGSVNIYNIVTPKYIYAGGILGHGFSHTDEIILATGGQTPFTVRYCLNSEDASIDGKFFTKGGRAYFGGIIGNEGNKVALYTFQHCYNLMPSFDITSNGDNTGNYCTGAIVGQVSTAEAANLATMDYCFSVKTVRNTKDFDTSIEAYETNRNINYASSEDYFLGGLVNTRGNAAGSLYWKKIQTVTGKLTSQFGYTVVEMKEFAVQCADALNSLFGDVTTVDIEDILPIPITTDINYVGCQENTPVDGKFNVRFITTLDYATYHEYGMYIKINDEAEQKYTATKTVGSVMDKTVPVTPGKKAKTALQLGGQNRAYIITVKDLPATGDINLKVTSYYIDSEGDREQRAIAWNVVYKNGAYVEQHYEGWTPPIFPEEDVPTITNPNIDNNVAGEKWNGMYDFVKPTKGTGTEADPYQIESAENLAWLSLAVKNAKMAAALTGTEGSAATAFKGVYFKQTADIDLNGKNFMPIGNFYVKGGDSAAFAGVYDGNGKTISNAIINPANFAEYESSSDSVSGMISNGVYAAGIFGVINDGAIIKNVKASKLTVGGFDEEETDSVTKAYNTSAAGAIVGINVKSSVENCTTDADTVVAARIAGGIVGVNQDAVIITKCVNKATVYGDRYVGGITGSADSDISYCLNEGSLTCHSFKKWGSVGGILGAYADTKGVTISYCVNKGELSVYDLEASDKNRRKGVGGIAGYDTSASKAITYSYCYNFTATFNAVYVNTGSGAGSILTSSGGIVGYFRDGSSAGRSFDHCYSVAGTVVEDRLGTPKTVKWEWKQDLEENATYSFAGLMTGVMSDAQLLKGFGDVADMAAVNALVTDCAYGKTAAEMEADSNYQAIIAALPQ